jgi:fructose-specific phosphotransferase system IIC component
MPARRVRKGRWFLAMLLVLALAGLALAVSFIEKSGITPRALAPYIAKRTAGHNSTIVGTGAFVAARCQP